MRPLRLSARNFRTWGELDLELPEGVVAVVGANGAGKSSLLTLIDLCLFGSRSLADHLTAGADAMQIELEFEHREMLYRVRRSYSARGRGQTKVDLETWRDGGWVPLTCETAAATQELIEHTLGLSRETFRASAFAAQGDGAAFTEASPRDRKQVLAEILDLSLWDSLLERAKGDRVASEAESARLSARLEVAEQELARLPSLREDRDRMAAERDCRLRQLEALETELAGLEAELAAGTAAQAELAGLRTVERELASSLASLDRRIGLLTDEDVDIREQLEGRDQIAAKAARVRELERAVEALREYHHAARAELAALDEVAELSSRLSSLNATIARVKQEQCPVCPTCEQQLPDEARQVALGNLSAQADEIVETLTEAQQKVREAELRRSTAQYDCHDWLLNDPTPLLAEARDAANRLVRLDEMASRLPAIRDEIDLLIAERDRKRADLDEIRAKIGQLEAVAPGEGVQARTSLVRRSIQTARDEISRIDRELAICNAEIERLAQTADQADLDRREATVAQERAETLRTLERAYGRDGIPAIILENTAIPQIEAEANRILADLDTSYRVELRTQRALKTVDGHRDALDIVVTDNGTDRMYETFSGGERTRLNLSLRIALARLLAHRRGADVRMLALDEPEFLDERGMESLARVLRGLTGDFDVILVVSHVPALREAFDQTIEIEKTDRGSIVTTQTAPMEVAA